MRKRNDGMAFFPLQTRVWPGRAGFIRMPAIPLSFPEKRLFAADCGSAASGVAAMCRRKLRIFFSARFDGAGNFHWGDVPCFLYCSGPSSVPSSCPPAGFMASCIFRFSVASSSFSHLISASLGHGGRHNLSKDRDVLRQLRVLLLPFLYHGGNAFQRIDEVCDGQFRVLAI